MRVNETKIDWEELREHKAALVELRAKLWETPPNVLGTDQGTCDHLSGIIHFIDGVQDAAIEQGIITVEDVIGPNPCAEVEL